MVVASVNFLDPVGMCRKTTFVSKIDLSAEDAPDPSPLIANLTLETNSKFSVHVVLVKKGVQRFQCVAKTSWEMLGQTQTDGRRLGGERSDEIQM